MNWIILDTAALVVLILFFTFGRRRGFVAMALLLVGTLAALWAAQHFAQPAAHWVYQNYAEERLIQYVDRKLEENSANEESIALTGTLEVILEEILPLTTLDGIKEQANDLLAELQQFIEDSAQQGEIIPYSQQDQADPRQQTQIEQLMESGIPLSTALVETVLQPLALSLLEMLAFLLLFLLISFLFRLLIHASRIFNQLPLVGGVNRFFGGLCGLAEGLVFLYVIGIFLRMLAATASADSFLTSNLLEETKLLSPIIFFLE